MWQDGSGNDYPAALLAGELAGDEALARVARVVNQRIYGRDGVRDRLVRALRLRPEAIVKVPTLFRGDADGGRITALTPNPINLLVCGRNVVLPMPFGPRGVAEGQADDLYMECWSQIFRRLDLEPLYLDGWNALHRHEGGLRCGINALRAPASGSARE
jgi:hypothetical protein